MEIVQLDDWDVTTLQDLMRALHARAEDEGNERLAGLAMEYIVKLAKIRK